MEIITRDSSFTIFNETFQECYHSTNDGAYNETLYKHVIPAFNHIKNKQHIKILDICFGLGYNTLCFLNHAQENLYQGTIEIHSPEINLIDNLYTYKYPKAFDLNILKSLCKTHFYKDKKTNVFLHIGDARDTIRRFVQNNLKFDIVFQDAFSPIKNKKLWSYEYFKDLYKITKKDSIITTYSLNSSMLYSAFLAGFKSYKLKHDTIKDSVIMLKNTLNVDNTKEIDINNKIRVNKSLIGIYD
ncbi:tRNA (5-methylaminomethyl-2-thiouridine)(34)-methyltransferase MnmD [Helicobacter sp. WB40]|uniref:tRNA (5-methylaminomethyl-2-thiouridine)(34)-methyltransferase MnmD n=1 Tax=Helicobacter sp. WB40 TaxID=3004130 RepID=UPI0022EBFE14|nr:MnmC family methyltransferase [Helicobacter sp. WB40]MDA3966955.1 MnmC family methyltransferase [Helicobacter sp. WB40]